MFFKRRSRTRADSYVDEYESPPTGKYEGRPSSSRQSREQHNSIGNTDANADNTNGPVSPIDARDMYPRPQAPQEPAPYQQHSQRPVANGVMGHSAMPLMDPVSMPSKTEPMPDLLARAFNEAVRPYTDKIEQLEGQLADLQAWVEQLEQERAEVHSWIDKRGLRPDVPPTIAKAMDSTPDAAKVLSPQLDRKITIVNFDLHRLQDDLNDSISSAHFASAMAKFLPDIERLSALPTGPAYAFDLVLKLGGNLNSHGGLETGDPADLAARRDFYARLDTAMVDVVRRRFKEGGEWQVQREISRIERTGAYLKGYGIEPYFPKTLDLMRRELDGRNAGASQAAQQQQIPQGTPPRYH